MSDDSLHKADGLLAALAATYDGADYPPGFSERYVVMECLGEGLGCDTFLVQDHEGAPFVAKCYDKAVWQMSVDDDVLLQLDHPGIPKSVVAFHGEKMMVAVREYVEGVPLDRYAHDNDLSERDIAKLCAGLCDILDYLHRLDPPLIHRDIKPQNVIVRDDGSVALIDFDIARTWREGSDTDTRFFGTVAYAPPEQYGFAQTDARADIYSLGVLLRYLLTGSPRANRNVRVCRPLEKVIDKCTAFDPNNRYSDVGQVKRGLSKANPRMRAISRAVAIICAVAVIALAVFGAVKAYEALTYSPFSGEHVAAVADDDAAIADAVGYLKGKYGTKLFDDVDAVATVGLLRQALIELYGFNRDYVYAHQDEGELPGEGDGSYFLPWGWSDAQNIARDYAAYAAVKARDPSLVAEDKWTVLKDDTGEYPGARVAALICEERGITDGVGRPFDITVGELALILANADRSFGA